jgi:hypothetical protein
MKVSVFPSSGEGVGDTYSIRSVRKRESQSLGPLETVNPNHWAR